MLDMEWVQKFGYTRILERICEIVKLGSHCYISRETGSLYTSLILRFLILGLNICCLYLLSITRFPVENICSTWEVFL